MNLAQKILVTFIISLMMLGCSPTSKVPKVNDAQAQSEAALQKELAIKEYLALSQRLLDVSQPIMISNAELCGKLVTNYIGVDYATLDTTPDDFKDKMKSLFRVSEQPTVILMAKNAPAEGALQVGDAIVKVNGKAVPKGKRGVPLIYKSLGKSKSTTVVFRVKRNGTLYDVNIAAKRGCASPVKVIQSDLVNAVADGKSIGVTRGMMRFVANDTELATVIGHELAHNSRRHIDAKKANAAIGTIAGIAVSVAIRIDVTRIGTAAGSAAHSHGFEIEADYVGLYHIARAGFDISQAPTLWRRMAASNPGSIGFKKGTHPSSARRFITLEATVAEIEQKRSAGQALVPEETRAQFLSKQKENS